MQDRSGALASRMILLQFEKSFYGCEDRDLFEKKLKPEIAGILNWSLVGLARLEARGHFEQPETGRDSIDVATEVGSNIISFFHDRCEIGTDGDVVSTDRLYMEWAVWCRENNIEATSKVWFLRDLKAAYPQLSKCYPKGSDGKQHYSYRGIKLK